MALCPCGSGSELDACCGPLLKNEKKAETAEALMRSRYSAFVLGNVDYIISSHHPSTNEDLDKEAIDAWSKNSKWLGLTVVLTSEGSKSDKNGVVEFKAEYVVEGQSICHHEVSQFVKEDDSWFYLDGKVLNTPQKRSDKKVGRNDPCHCGSGKKYKKCCLNIS